MKQLLKLFAVALVATSFTLVGCKSGNGVMSKVTPRETDKCIKVAMQKPSTRAWGEGKALRESQANALAEANARAQFRAKLEAAVLRGVKDYASMVNQTSSADDGGVWDIESKVDVQEAVGGIVSYTNIIETSIYDENDANGNRLVHVYVCIEYNGDVANMAEDIAKKVKANKKISDKDRKRIERDEQRFIEEIKKQLEQMR